MRKSFIQYISETKKTKALGWSDWVWKRDDNSHLGKDDNEVSKSLSKGQNLSSHHIRAIDEYTSNYNKDLNRNLIAGKKLSPKHQKIAQDMDDAIKNNPISKNTTVYSRLGYDPRSMADKNGTFSTPAYTSTTHSKREVVIFGKHSEVNPLTKRKESHRLQISLKPGDSAMHIGARSIQPGEHETLIARNAKMRIVKTDVHQDGNVYHHIHHVELV